MNSEKFDSLVAKLEKQARETPKTYQLKVFFLALLGNIYIAVVLLALLAIVIFLVFAIATLRWLAVKGIILIGPIIWMVMKSLKVSVNPPEGFELKQTDAPDLFALIKDLQRKLKAPRFHHVLITNEFNAGVIQSPRLGIFGWYRNYLLIGLPLLHSLSKDQFNAVLAHEFGHLTRGHGRVSNWIYRQRRRWSRLLEELRYENKGVFLFKPFFEWFSPYFNAFSFPLARANEYVADAISAEMTSAKVAAEALTRVDVIGCYLSEKFWPQIYKLADDQPSPQFAPYQSLGQSLADEIDEESVQRWMGQALERKTNSADTHLSLSDRLQALNEMPQLIIPKITAEQLLGASLSRATEYCDERWQNNVFETWRRRYNEVADTRKELAKLDKKYASGAELTLREAYERALYTETVTQDKDGALSQFRELHERAPGDAFVCLYLGMRLLWRDDEAGLALIERAIDIDEDTLCQAYEAQRDYHWRNGRQELAKDFNEKLVARAQLERAAQAERQAILITDTFDIHDLDGVALNELCAQLTKIEGLRKAYLVKKQLRHLPHKSLYVLGFSIKRGFGLRPKYTHDEVMHQLKTKIVFPHPTFLINLGVNKKFSRKLKRPDSEIILT